MRRNAANLIAVIFLAGATALGQDAGPPAPPPPSASEPPSESPAVVKAKALLAEMTRAYQAAPVFSDRVIVRYSYGGTPRTPFEATMLLGAGTDAVIVSGGNTVTAVGDTMTVTYPQYEDRYLEVPLEGNVVDTLTKLFGRFGGPIGPAAFRYGKPTDVLVAVLGYGLPDPPRISGYREITDTNGEPRHQISLVSASGSVAVNVDPETRFIDTIALEYVGANAPVPNFRITLDLEFNPEVLERLPEPINFDPAGRMAFSRREAMAGNALPESLRHVKVKPGDTAPDFTLYTLEGAKVRLADLRGSVVVLCFWARHNEESQTAMHAMQKIADWADASSLPVDVRPIHALGRGPASEGWEQALQYWESHPFTFMSLIDEDGAVPKAYGITGVPMLVLIDREGKVVKVTSGLAGVDPESIEKDILTTLGVPSPGP